jgi:hypothetical protein
VLNRIQTRLVHQFPPPMPRQAGKGTRSHVATPIGCTLVNLTRRFVPKDSHPTSSISDCQTTPNSRAAPMHGWFTGSTISQTASLIMPLLTMSRTQYYSCRIKSSRETGDATPVDMHVVQ